MIRGHLDVVKLLLQHGADVNQADIFGTTVGAHALNTYITHPRNNVTTLRCTCTNVHTYA